MKTVVWWTAGGAVAKSSGKSGDKIRPKAAAQAELAAKLDRLADLINQRFDQLEGRAGALSLPSHRPDPAHTPDRQNQTAEAEAVRQPPEATHPQPEPIWQTRLTELEQQVQQLTRRVQDLERQAFNPTLGGLGVSEIILEDDDMEDQPDEILWEFMEPGERS
ncbi:MAG: hypothetical protein ACKO7W_02510 [Elainella sp.]